MSKYFLNQILVGGAVFIIAINVLVVLYAVWMAHRRDDGDD